MTKVTAEEECTLCMNGFVASTTQPLAQCSGWGWEEAASPHEKRKREKEKDNLKLHYISAFILYFMLQANH